MKATIVVYENPVSNKVIQRFDDTNDLEKYAEKHNTPADSVSINGMMLLGWDELYEFI